MTRISLAAAALLALASPLHAEDATMSYDAAKADITATIGGFPTFLKTFPRAGLAGAWSELKAMEFSTDTALSPKEKSLISLAVAAQIPCSYCVWADTQSARQAGATDEEIAEAVAMAALTRHWSTIFNGLQVDMATFQKEMSGDFTASN